MQEYDRCLLFEQLILPHLDAAYNLAHWLTRNNEDAQDIVQEACLRAYRFLPSFRGGSSRAWLLAIVRNTCYTWLHQQHTDEIFNEELHDRESAALDPEHIYMHLIEQEKVKEAIEALPLELREVTVLREMEELSYKEISAIVHIPMGTVMSRLSHARARLHQYLVKRTNEEENDSEL